MTTETPGREKYRIVRDSDRLWWIAGLISLAMFVAALLALWWAPRLPVLDDPNPTDPLSLTLAVFIGLICLGGSVLGASATRTVRRRHMTRMAAFCGACAGMPVSIIQPFPERAPDVSIQPMEIIWQANPVTAPLQGLLMGVSLLGACLTPAAILTYVLLSRLDPALIPGFLGPPDRAPLDAGQIAWLIVYALILALGVAFGAWLAIRPGPTLFFGRPFGLRVTAEGIEERDE